MIFNQYFHKNSVDSVLIDHLYSTQYILPKRSFTLSKIIQVLQNARLVLHNHILHVPPGWFLERHKYKYTTQPPHYHTLSSSTTFPTLSRTSGVATAGPHIASPETQRHQGLALAPTRWGFSWPEKSHNLKTLWKSPALRVWQGVCPVSRWLPLPKEESHVQVWVYLVKENINIPTIPKSWWWLLFNISTWKCLGLLENV